MLALFLLSTVLLSTTGQVVFPDDTSQLSASTSLPSEVTTRPSTTTSSLLAVVEGNSCRTPPPQSSSGRCISHLACPEIMRLLQRRSEPAVKQFLTESNCGFKDRVPLFCCPSTSENIQVVPSIVPSVPSNPAGVNTREYLRNLCVEEGILDLKIFGGRRTQPGQFPWAALLAYPNTNRSSTNTSFFCGGTLISNRHVITAAHCVLDEALRLEDLVFVRVGEHNYKRVGESEHRDVGIRRIIPHPDYVGRPNFYNDIAIIVLQDELNVTKYIAPICLPVLGDKELLDRNLPIKVIGWGKTEKKSQGSEVLLQADVPIVDDATCAEKYKARGIVFDGKMQLCAGGQQGTDTCSGDSGGAAMFLLSGVPAPAIPKFVLGGVTSFGSVKCGTGLPAVYTRVQHFLPWIINNIQFDL